MPFIILLFFVGVTNYLLVPASDRITLLSLPFVGASGAQISYHLGLSSKEGAVPVWRLRN
jgi:hypothetical protein